MGCKFNFSFVFLIKLKNKEMIDLAHKIISKE